MSRRSASAFSRRRFPMKHQGHTTSEKTSIASGDVVMVGSCIGANLCTARPRRNRVGVRHAGNERLHAVTWLKNSERYGRVKAHVLLIDAGQGSAQGASDTTHERMGIAQSGVGEGEQDRAVVGASGNVSWTCQPDHLSGRTVVERMFGRRGKRKAGKRQRGATLAGVIDCAFELAQKRVRR